MKELKDKWINGSKTDQHRVLMLVRDSLAIKIANWPHKVKDPQLLLSEALKRALVNLNNPDSSAWEHPVDACAYRWVKQSFKEYNKVLDIEREQIPSSPIDNVNPSNIFPYDEIFIKKLSREYVNQFLCRDDDCFLLNARLGLLEEHKYRKMKYTEIGRIIGKDLISVKLRLKKILKMIKINKKNNITFKHKELEA